MTCPFDQIGKKEKIGKKERGTHRNRSSRVSEVAERMGVTVDYAQKYRKRLIDGGVIESAGRGYVGFAVPYLRDYLCRVE